MAKVKANTQAKAKVSQAEEKDEAHQSCGQQTTLRHPSTEKVKVTGHTLQAKALAGRPTPKTEMGIS